MAIGEKISVIMETEKNTPGGIPILTEECTLPNEVIPEPLSCTFKKFKEMDHDPNTYYNVTDDVLLEEDYQLKLAEVEYNTNQNTDNIGNLEDLATEDKSSIVNAINEVKASANDNFSIVFESEIIFEGTTGNFTKPIENFDAISFLTHPTRTSDANFTGFNPMIPTKQLLDRISIMDDIKMFNIWANTNIQINMNRTSITYNTTDMRVYGHKIKVVNE